MTAGKKFNLVSACVFAAAAASSSSGATIFTENMGTPGGTTAIASNTFQNSGTLTYSGTGDVRSTTVSTTYAGASGGGNVFLTNTAGRYFEISGINTSAYVGGSLDLTFGAFKSNTTSNMSELSLQYSTDGTTFSSLSFAAQPTGTGTAVWRSISIVNSAIPVSSSLYLRWTNTSSTPQFRLDDVKLEGDLASATPNDSVISAPASISGGRVVSGGSIAVPITKTGTEATSFVVTNASGGFSGSGGSLGAGSQSSAATILVGTTLGIRSGSVAIDNTATTSAAAGQGSDDADDTISVSATVVKNRQVGDAASVSTPTAASSVIDVGRVLVGATSTGTGLLKTTGIDDENTRLTVQGGKTAFFTSAAGTVTLTSTGPSDTVFDADTDTATISGSATYTAAGAKSNFLTLVDAASTSTSTSVAKSLVGEGLVGESLQSARVFITATALDPKDVSFVSGDGTIDTAVIDLGDLTEGSSTSFALTVFNLLKTVGFTAGAEFDSLSTDAGLSLSSSPSGLIDAGLSGDFNFVFDTTGYSLGLHTINGSISFLNDSTIAGAAAAGLETLSFSADVNITAVPEPTVLGAIGLGGLALLRRRRR